MPRIGGLKHSLVKAQFGNSIREIYSYLFCWLLIETQQVDEINTNEMILILALQSSVIKGN